jgi:tRNA-dependent cyclodipeptide synthase
MDHSTISSLIVENHQDGYIEATARYRAKIACVSPQSRRKSFEFERQCFISVSLENRNFEPPRFQAVLKWVASRFSKCRIVVGDSIHRITLETGAGMPPHEAKPAALRLGRSFIEENCTLVNSYDTQTQFEFATYNDIQQSPLYAQFHQEIRTYFNAVPSFKASVEGCGLRFHRHNWDKLYPEDRTHRLKRSCDYFLEEFAVFACLVKEGNSVMVYPGGILSTFSEITMGLFPDMLRELAALSVVSLQVKKR